MKRWIEPLIFVAVWGFLLAAVLKAYHAEVPEPTSIHVGRDVVLTADVDHEVRTWIWYVQAPDRTFLPVTTEYGGRRVRFVDGSLEQEGRYIVLLIAIAPDGTASQARTHFDNRDTTPPDPKPDPKPDPDENPHGPPAEAWKTLAEPLAKNGMEREHAAAVADALASLASSVSSGEVKTNQELRRKIMESLEPLGLKGKYPKMREGTEAVMEKALGKKAQDKVDPKPAAELLRTMAYYVWEAGR
jgi:hypothetical protein